MERVELESLWQKGSLKWLDGTKIVISKIYRFSSEQSKEAKNSKIERYQNGNGKTIASVFAFSSLEMVRSGTINEQRVNI